MMTAEYFDDDSPSKNTRSKGPSIFENHAYCWLFSDELYLKHEKDILDRELHLYHYVAHHDENCHRLKAKGPHYHVLVWTNSERYSDSRIVRKFRALDPFKQQWSYEKARKVDSLLLYLNHYEKTYVRSILSETMQAEIDKLPKDGKDRMDGYIVKRDVSAKPLKVPDVVHILKTYHSTTYDQLSLVLAAKAAKGSKECQDLLMKITAQQNIRFITIQANEYIRKENTGRNPIQFLNDWEKRHEDDREFLDQYYTIAETRDWIKRILAFNGLDYDQVTSDIAQLIMKYTTKRNCIWVYGESNAGKSIFLRSIVSGFPTHGQLIPSRDFMFQDCQDQPILFSEETRITLEVISDFKKVAEGTMIHANKKYKEAFELYRTPILCASNETPWRNVVGEQAPLKNRILFYQFNTNNQLRLCVKDLNPLFWLHHYNRAYLAKHGRVYKL